VSSTLGELAQERAVVRDAVEQLRLTPIMFELGARSHPPQALYRSYLEQSDVFVGIYWQSYGWVAPDMGISGLEDEYERSAGMPRLLYVKRPAPDLQPGLAALLARIKEEDSTSYKSFRDSAELHDLVLDDLAVLLTERFDAVDQAAASPEVPTNLPVLPSSFIGREGLRSELRRILRSKEARLVTLTGAGGAGKTRLALETAGDVVPAFGDGVFFVDLSAEHAPDEVFAAIVRAVPLPGVTDDPPRQALERGLRKAQMLLVLDNFEQAMDAATGLSELLLHCPHLTVLVTSRESLRLRGEILVAVPPLSLPEHETVTVAEAEGSEAVRLFVDRAAALVPGFALTHQNATDVAAICALLDGLPLAVELAAARVKLFAVDELRARLEQRLDDLSGTRDLPERQQTLRRAIEWSTELLREDDRAVLAALSVFTGARIPDVEAVLTRVPGLGDVDVVDCLDSLVDKSLVRNALAHDGRPRLSLLRIIRTYAAEQLASRPDVATAVHRSHAEHYTELARGWRTGFGPAHRDDVLALVSVELGNLRGAWSHWVHERAVVRLDDLLELLWGYYDQLGNYREAVDLGRDLLGVLCLQPDTPDRLRDEIAVETSLARSMIAVRGYTAEVERSIRAAIERSDAVGHAPQRFSVLRSLATLHLLGADIERSAAVGLELLALAEKQREPALLAEAHLVAGVTAMGRDLSDSLQHLEQSIDQFHAQQPSLVQFRVGPSPGVVAYVISGLILWQTGFPDRARLRIDRGIELAAEIGHPYSTAYALFHGSVAALWQQDLGRVAEQAEELLRIAEAHDYPVWRALAFILRGSAWTGSGNAEVGLPEVDRGFSLYEGLSTPPVFWAQLLSIRAVDCLAAGRLGRASDLVEEAASVDWDGDPQESDVEILRGDLLLASPVPDRSAAEVRFERAAALAERRGARISHLVAATRLAELRGGTPRDDEARVALRAVYETFTEGFDIPQLRAARALLEDSGSARR
jgi:predicted ATPase